jgi:hypothetical protein
VLPGELAATWQARAKALNPYAPGAAAAFRTAAAELEAALRDAGDELLTLEQASTESLYSERRLREFLTDGTIPQAGRKHAPRIRRADLPKRAKSMAAANRYDPLQHARELARPALAGGNGG